MLLSDISHYCGGVVMVRVTGVIPEKFINLCITRGILLWGIKRFEHDLFAYMRLADFLSIRPVARLARVRIKVVSHYGLPFLIQRLLRRKMMVAGAVLFIILLQWITSYVWFVEVTGLKSLPREQIIEVAAQNGLKPGILKGNISSKQIENALLLNIPELAWVGVGFSGTRAVIEVVEKTLPRSEDKSPAHIFAAKSGVITELITIAGQPNVKKGDIVKEGDLLIKGFPPQPAALQEASQPNRIVVPAQLIRARGMIKAQIRYEGYGEGYLEETVYERTGRKETEVSVQIGEQNYTIRRATTGSFERFDTEIVHKSLPAWRNHTLAVESTIKNYYELMPRQVTLSPEEARERAKTAALDSLKDQIPEAAQLVTRNVELVPSSDPNTVKIKVTVDTIEEIGQIVPIGQ